MIVSVTDTIPGKKIVKAIGPVYTKPPLFGLALFSPERAQKNLEEQAEKLGANAIVGLKVEAEQRRRGRVQKYRAYGTAVIVE